MIELDTYKSEHRRMVIATLDEKKWFQIRIRFRLAVNYILMKVLKSTQEVHLTYKYVNLTIILKNYKSA